MQGAPIQWLPVFEAAARHLSFKQAAQELHVTPPAVSQQIKALEEYLGVALFERQGRRLHLTLAGQFYQNMSQDMLATYSRGHLEFARRFKSRSLQISAPLFVAHEVLIPNYLSFQQYASGVELRITTGMSYVDFAVEPVDAAIRFGDGQWPQLQCRRLCEAGFTVVASPAYLAQHGPISLAQLRHHKLISASAEMMEWRTVLGEQGIQDRLICDSYFASLKAAADGLGLALAILPSANEWINQGRLQPLFDWYQTSQLGYWLVAPKHTSEPRVLDGLYGWSKSLFDALPALQQPLNPRSVD